MVQAMRVLASALPLAAAVSAVESDVAPPVISLSLEGAFCVENALKNLSFPPSIHNCQPSPAHHTHAEPNNIAESAAQQLHCHPQSFRLTRTVETKGAERSQLRCKIKMQD
jgi:hypothetical protein